MERKLQYEKERPGRKRIAEEIKKRKDIERAR